MNNDSFVPKIPYGMRDLLPQEAACKRSIEEALSRLFTLWGYEEVVSPTIEYLETFRSGTNGDVENTMFKFFDKSNRLLALRPDMTTPIARIAATRLRECMLPLKLFYLSNVFRYEEAQAGRQCEFHQAGVELLGSDKPVADAEIIALAIEGLMEAGLTTFQISMGQVQFVNGIMNELDLPQELRTKIKAAIVNRDLVGLKEIMTDSGLNERTQSIIQQIPLLYGREDMLKKAYSLTGSGATKAALDNLSEIYGILAHYGVDKYVNFDLGIIRSFDYYTGMVFEGYTPGLGFPICGGGRYDKLVSSFGLDCPATGFALGIERILLARERQGIAVKSAPRHIYIGWQDGKLAQAISKARDLRQSGRIVDIGLTPQKKDEAEKIQDDKGYAELVFIGD